MNRRCAFVLVAVAFLSAGSASGARDPWASLHRPLRLAPLAPGALCPVTTPHLLVGGLSGSGRGPIYPLPTRFSAYDRMPGWLGAKTLWAWRPALRSRAVRVLVRGERLDRPGVLRFQQGPDWGSPRTPELHIDTRFSVGSFGGVPWGATVTMLLVRKAGCYGLQLDSAQGTSTIVVKAR
jgi:hypothetical protein